MFISGYANTENVFYCLKIVHVLNKLGVIDNNQYEMSIQIIYNEAKKEQFTFSSVNREKIRKNKAEHFIIKFHLILFLILIRL